jgi:hypothetical protein
VAWFSSDVPLASGAAARSALSDAHTKREEREESAIESCWTPIISRRHPASLFYAASDYGSLSAPLFALCQGPELVRVSRGAVDARAESNGVFVSHEFSLDNTPHTSRVTLCVLSHLSSARRRCGAPLAISNSWELVSLSADAAVCAGCRSGILAPPHQVTPGIWRRHISFSDLLSLSAVLLALHSAIQLELWQVRCCGDVVLSGSIPPATR